MLAANMPEKGLQPTLSRRFTEPPALWAILIQQSENPVYFCFSWFSITFFPLLQISRLKIIVLFSAFYLERYSTTKDDPWVSEREIFNPYLILTNAWVTLLAASFHWPALVDSLRTVKKQRTQICQTLHKNTNMKNKYIPQNSTIRITKQQLCQSLVKNIVALGRNIRAYRTHSTIFSGNFFL